MALFRPLSRFYGGAITQKLEVEGGGRGESGRDYVILFSEWGVVGP